MHVIRIWSTFLSVNKTDWASMNTKNFFRYIIALLLLTALGFNPDDTLHAQTDEPLQFGIAGLVHGHVNGFLNRNDDRDDIDIVGVYEPSQELIEEYADRYRLDESIFYTDLEEMLENTNPEAVAIFSSTYDHKDIVEVCAGAGIHVMMEKPMAVSMDHAKAMKNVVEENNVHLIVNYETTWYPSNHSIYDLVVNKNAVGGLRKMVVHDGHRGPIEIGVSAEFLEWLTDPKLNGGGALTDFGCYGANLITWLMNNQRPISVFAVTQQIKTDPAYARVDDETTIILTYPQAQGIIQASWNWPFSRKDMEVYGEIGFAHALNRTDMHVRYPDQPEAKLNAPQLAAPHSDPLSYLKAVVRGEINPDGLSSMENNMIVTEILDAARESAKTGKAVNLK